MNISPTPTDEEAAALAAAIELAWPRPVVPEESQGPPRWRFSGRWWARPVQRVRLRP